MQHSVLSSSANDTSEVCVDSGLPFDATTEQTDSEGKKFAACLRTAINTNDKQWIAAHVWYPIKVVVRKNLRIIHNKAEFVKFYNDILDRDIRQTAASNTFWTVNRLNGAFMIDDGEIWIMLLPPPGTTEPVSVVKFYITVIQG